MLGFTVALVLAAVGHVAAEAGVYQQVRNQHPLGTHVLTLCVSFYQATTPQLPKGIYNIFCGAGNNVSNIATYQFNEKAKTLKIVANSTTGENPSWLALHPTRKNIL
jgi:hypothetical protein